MGFRAHDCTTFRVYEHHVCFINYDCLHCSCLLPPSPTSTSAHAGEWRPRRTLALSDVDAPLHLDPSPPKTISPMRDARHTRFETIELNTHNDVLDCVSRLEPKTDDIDAEPPQIHNLTINVAAIPKPFATSFSSRVFNHATCSSMQKLAFANAEEFLRSDHNFAEGFARLTALRTLLIENIGKDACWMLLNMQSSLRTAELCFHTPSQELSEDAPLANPLSLLRSSQSTLERVKLVGGGTEATPFTYPRVTTLALERVHAPRTLDYIHAFPNLRHLSITGARFTDLADDGPCTCFATQREANVADQGEHGEWATLDSVTGGVLDVYTLGLRTSVTRLALTGRAEGCWDAPFAAVLDDVNPEELQVTTTCGAVSRSGEGFAAALCAERDWPLVTLCAVLEVGCVDTPEDVQDALVRTATYLACGGLS